jgi:hypothetical protein
MRRYQLSDIALAHTVSIAVPAGQTVFTMTPQRYEPVGNDIDLFGLA